MPILIQLKKPKYIRRRVYEKIYCCPYIAVFIFFYFMHWVFPAQYAYIPSVYGSDVTVFDTETYG